MLLKGGMFPVAYVYPREMRAVRDLMRRRMFFVHRRSELFAHVQMTFQQFNLPEPGRELAYQAKRAKLELPFKDQATISAVEADLFMIEHLSTCIRKLEYQIKRQSLACSSNEMTLRLLQTIPGIGDVLSATILYEIHDVARFPTVQNFASYARLVKPDKVSAGKKTGEGGGKIGNAHLKWAFSEAAAIALRDERIKKYMARLQKRHAKSKAMTIIAHKLGRAAYFMLQRNKPFDEERFFASMN
jgi:transposase